MNTIGLATQVTSPAIIPPVAPPQVAGNASRKEATIVRAAGEAEAGAALNNQQHQDPALRNNSEAEFSKEDLAKLQELRARDREVRAHEMAHLAAAGKHAMGGPSFTFEVGPDGRRYAVGGEVKIDTSAVAGDPAATLAKAQQVRRAALAPADPSAQDRRIATQATAMAAKARSDMAAAKNDQAPSVTEVAGSILVDEIV